MRNNKKSTHNVDDLYRGELEISWQLYFPKEEDWAELYKRNVDTSKMDYGRRNDYLNAKAMQTFDNTLLFTQIFEKILDAAYHGEIYSEDDDHIGWFEYEWRSKRGITYDK